MPPYGSRNTSLRRSKSGKPYRRHVGEIRFHIGHDAATAKQRADALQKLWQFNLTELGLTEGKPLKIKPYWVPRYLAAARQIEKGIQPTLPSDGLDDEAYVERLQKLKAVVGIEFVAENQPLIDDNLRSRRKRAAEDRQKLAEKTGQRLFQALEPYEKHLRKTYTVGGQISDHGRTMIDRIRIFKNYLTDCDLAELDFQRLQSLIDVFRQRPLSVRYKRPLSFKFAQDCIKEFRSFLNWLHLDKEHYWRKPEDYGLLKLKPHEIDEDAEKEDVPTWTLDELKTLWSVATPLERVVMALALNGAMGADQLGRLKTRHLNFEKNQISRVRRKKMVRVRHHLFAVSKKALEWYLERRPTPVEDSDTILITKNGVPYYRQTQGGNRSRDLPNLWNHLLDRAEAAMKQEGKTFRRLPFNSLRDTSSNFVRRIAGAEIASLHLAHKHQSSDKELGSYTNPDRKRHTKALKKLEARLDQKVFSAVAEPFPVQQETAAQKGGGAGKLPPAMIKKIRQMAAAGFKKTKIAEECGTTTKTVWHYLKKPR